MFGVAEREADAFDFAERLGELNEELEVAERRGASIGGTNRGECNDNLGGGDVNCLNQD